MTANGILAIWNDCEPGREAEFEEWYQAEHLAERLAVPGFLLGRRCEAVSGSPRYFGFYLTQTPEVLASPPYLARLNDPTPLTRSVMTGAFRNMIRTVCRRTASVGRPRGAFIVTLRFAQRPERDNLLPLLESLVRDRAVARAELWEAAEPQGLTASAEERLRGGDHKIGACLAVDALREGPAESVASRLFADFPAAELGVYRLLCEIRRCPGG
jgi:hypothetical protein